MFLIEKTTKNVKTTKSYIVNSFGSFDDDSLLK